MKNKICETCNKEFSNKHIYDKNAKFCSKDCRWEWARLHSTGRTTGKCKICGEKLSTKINNTQMCLSCYGKNHIPWNKDLKNCYSDETREKMSMSAMGKIISPETRRKIGEKSKLHKHSEEAKKKIGETHSGSKCNFWKGGKKREECIVCGKEFYNYNYQKNRRHCSNECRYITISNEKSGENSILWQGGKSFEEYTVDWTRTLRRAIRERDNYTCQVCGLEQGDRAHSVHHIDYDKKNCNPDNLITLCTKCHIKTNFEREYWTDLFTGKVGELCQN